MGGLKFGGQRHFNIGEISYKIVEEIYLCFGIEADKTPYISEIDGIKIIDESKLKSV